MAADVVEAAQFAICAARDQYLLAGNLSSDEIAWLRDLFSTSNYLPVTAEDFFALRSRDRRAGVVAGGQSGSNSNVRIDQTLDDCFGRSRIHAATPRNF